MVQGASYTDVNAQLPALNFLAIVAVICAILFFVNIRLRIWALPIIAVLLLAIVSVLLGTAYPAFVQRFRVAPQEYQREQPYIEDNIAGTRRAFGLDAIDVENRPVDPLLTARDIKDNPTTIQNIRLWRQGILQENFQSSQRIRAVLRVQGRRRRPVHARERRPARADAVGPRGDPGRASPSRRRPGRTRISSTRTGSGRWPRR